MTQAQQNSVSSIDGEFRKDKNFRILSLDGGGAKGFYTLGVLRELEAMLGCRLYKCFDLIYGTSTGSIIGTLLAQGYAVEEIHQLYKKYVPEVMNNCDAKTRSASLSKLAKEVFKDTKFSDVKTAVGVVSTKWIQETPMIFKGSIAQAHGRQGTFVPGFGVFIRDAVQASCSAYPFFERKVVTTSAGDNIELIDGGYCANNPTLFAIADAINALKKSPEDIRVLSLGVGVYPEPKPSLKMWFAKKFVVSVQLLQKTLEINTQTMDQLRLILHKDVPTIRVSDTFSTPEMATDLLEADLEKLNILRQKGSQSYAAREEEIKKLLLSEEV
jgi:predicted patatin/cPLA2 family phospholipase